MAVSVLITARSTQPRKRQPTASREPQTGVEMKFWRRLVGTATHEAQATRAGQPTANAILARYWIETKQQSDDPLYSFSFDDACKNLSRDPSDARKRALAIIDATWQQAANTEWQKQYLQTRDAVLSCAGVAGTARSQGVLVLVAERDYSDAAMVEDDDEPMLPFLM